MLEILILTGVGVWLILALRSCFRGRRLLREAAAAAAQTGLPPLRSQPLTWPIPCFLPILDKIRWALPVKTPIDF